MKEDQIHLNIQFIQLLYLTLQLGKKGGIEAGKIKSLVEGTRKGEAHRFLQIVAIVFRKYAHADFIERTRRQRCQRLLLYIVRLIVPDVGRGTKRIKRVAIGIAEVPVAITLYRAG